MRLHAPSTQSCIDWVHALRRVCGGKLQAHPELGQLLGELVSSCQVHRPDDVFAHAASHFSAPEGPAAAPAAAEPAAKPAAAGQYTPAGFGAHYPSEQEEGGGAVRDGAESVRG